MEMFIEGLIAIVEMRYPSKEDGTYSLQEYDGQRGFTTLIKYPVEHSILEVYYSYGYIVTENDNVLCLSERWGTYEYTFQYRPSRYTGSGCWCKNKESDMQTYDKAGVEQAERTGMANAYQFKATRYHSSKQFFDQLWNKDKMIKL